MMLTISAWTVIATVLLTLLMWGGWELMKAISNFKDDSGQIGEDN